MGVSIIFRNDKNINYFRNNILGIIDDSEIQGILFSYPYFYEKKPYVDKTGIKRYAQYSILDDQLLQHILKKDDFWIGTISSSKNGPEWIESYEKFIVKLYSQIKSSNKKISLDCYSSKNKDRLWHAKFAIGFKKENSIYKPVILLMGSSNFTNKAFRKDINDFNYEIDAIIWNDKMYSYTINKKLKDESEGLGPIIALTNFNETYSNEGDYLDWFYRKFKSGKNNELEKLDLPSKCLDYL